VSFVKPRSIAMWRLISACQNLTPALGPERISGGDNEMDLVIFAAFRFDLELPIYYRGTR
jgi:hypothetical protein